MCNLNLKWARDGTGNKFVHKIKVISVSKKIMCPDTCALVQLCSLNGLKVLMRPTLGAPCILGMLSRFSVPNPSLI